MAVGRDLTVASGELICGATNGTVSASAARNIVVSAATGSLRGQTNTTCTAATSFATTGYFQVTSCTVKIAEGIGNATVTLVENLIINNGTFYGIYNTTAANNGTATLTCDNLNFTGGTMSFFHANASDGKTIQVNCASDINVSFQNTTDIITFIALAGANNAVLDLNVGYNIQANYCNNNYCCNFYLYFKH